MIVRVQEDLDFYFDNIVITSVEDDIFAYVDESGKLHFEAIKDGKRSEVDDENARLLISDTSRESILDGDRFECRLLYMTSENDKITEIITDGEIQICNNSGVLLRIYSNMIIKAKGDQVVEEKTDDKVLEEEPDLSIKAPTNVIQTGAINYSDILNPEAGKTIDKIEEDKKRK